MNIAARHLVIIGNNAVSVRGTVVVGVTLGVTVTVGIAVTVGVSVGAESQKMPVPFRN